MIRGFNPGAANVRLHTLTTCFLGALIEGIDLQSMGIAASGIASEFHLGRGVLGVVLTASPCGLLVGAFLGGRLADLHGRKSALIVSIVTFGVLQFVTAWADNSTGLIVIRFLCGVGLGGALPNLIAITAESGGGSKPILNVVITVAAMPLGGAVAASLGLISPQNWRLLFYVGGIAPLILAPLMAALLPKSSLFQRKRAESPKEPGKAVSALFAEPHRRQTWLLWAAFLGTALILFLLVNWLPQLMVAKGFSHSQSFAIQIAFNVASAAGAVALGWLMQRRPHRWLLLACYVGLAASLLLIAGWMNGVLLVASIAAIMGVCLVGAQFILYGLTPGYYPTLVRGTGTGAAVAVGRLGAIVGPFFAGQLLNLGASPGQVMESLLPVVLCAAIAASLLTLTPHCRDLRSNS